VAIAVWDVASANPWTTLLQGALQELGHVQAVPAAGPGMFALAAPGLLAEMLADAGFLDVTVQSVPILSRYADVTDWLGETLDRSRYFADVWAQLDDRQRRELREVLRARSSEYADLDGSLALPGSSLAAAASA
jgi:hypothetical protein